MIKFSKNLSNIMKQKRINQTELSKTAGISTKTLQRYLRDESSPDLKNLSKISEALQVPFEYLLKGETPDTPKNINQGVIGIGGVGDNHNITHNVNNSNNLNPIQTLPADIQVVVEELLQMDKQKRKKVVKFVYSMDD